MPSVWTFKAPRQRQHTTLAHASRRRHLRPDPTGGNRQSPLPVLLYIFYFPILFLTTFLSPSLFLVLLLILAARVNLVWLTTLCYAICGYSRGVNLAQAGLARKYLSRPLVGPRGGWMHHGRIEFFNSWLLQNPPPNVIGP